MCSSATGTNEISDLFTDDYHLRTELIMRMLKKGFFQNYYYYYHHYLLYAGYLYIYS